MTAHLSTACPERTAPSSERSVPCVWCCQRQSTIRLLPFVAVNGSSPKENLVPTCDDCYRRRGAASVSAFALQSPQHDHHQLTTTCQLLQETHPGKLGNIAADEQECLLSATASETLPLRIPSNKKHNNRNKYLRRKVAERDGWNCVWCNCVTTNEGGKLSNGNLGAEHNCIATLEHLVPVNEGGTNNLSNLALSCYACNNKRGHIPLFIWLPQCPNARREVLTKAGILPAMVAASTKRVFTLDKTSCSMI